MQPMDPDFAERRLADAEDRLTRALQRLHALRRAALAGGYDPLEFDRALVAYRRAEHEAMTAREALAGAAGPAPLPAGRAPEAGGSAVRPTPRMRFVRWLVQTGRLSEWDVALGAPAGDDLSALQHQVQQVGLRQRVWTS